MLPNNRSIRPVTSCLAAIGILFITMGCDLSDPVRVLPEDVAGNYTFNEFIFVPDASALDAANLLDTLVIDNTRLRLLDGGQFTLNYQFQGGSESLISGDFTVNESEIRLQAASGSEARLTSLLLHSPITFTRDIDNNRLESMRTKTVDLSSYSSRYAGVPPVQGQLYLELFLENGSTPITTRQ